MLSAGSGSGDRRWRAPGTDPSRELDGLHRAGAAPAGPLSRMTDTLQDPFTTAGVPVPEDVPPKRKRATTMLIRTAVIILVMVLLAELYARAIGPHFPVKLDALGEMVRKREQLSGPAGAQAQVIFVGDSMMDVGGDPATFAKASKSYEHAYNASLLGAPIAGTSTWMQQVVLPQTTPQVVVLGVAPSAVLAPDVDFSGVARDQVQDQISQTGSDTWLTLSQRAADMSALVKYRRSLRSPQAVADATSEALSGSDPPTNPVFEKMQVEGYWERTVNDLGQVVNLSADKLGRKFNPELAVQLVSQEPTFSSFDRALDMYAAQNVAVVVVVPPIAVAVWQDSGVDVAKWRAVAAEIKARATQHGVEAIDYTDAGYGRELFNDYVHLNEEGARRFSIGLAQQLDSMCTKQKVPCG